MLANLIAQGAFKEAPEEGKRDARPFSFAQSIARCVSRKLRLDDPRTFLPPDNSLLSEPKIWPELAW
jgi:hypothetical protein